MNIPSDLELIQKTVFQANGLEWTNIIQEKEGQAYFAYQFQMNGYRIKYRQAKITPTKTGQFVAIWKRNDKGITAPYDINDDIDFLIIATRQDSNFGIFIFPKSVLLENNIFSKELKEGKRGIRVYPIWDKPTNQQAQKTKAWQMKHFINFTNGQEVDFQGIKNIFYPKIK